MSDLPKTIKINELPETSSINDTDIFILEDGSVTHKITGKSLIAYIQKHGDISNYYVHQSSIDESNGIAPLDINRKIPSDNINFGTTTGTLFDGGRGKALEDGLDAHLLETNIHHTHDNKTVLDSITAEKVASWDAGSGDGSATSSVEIQNILNGTTQVGDSKKLGGIEPIGFIKSGGNVGRADVIGFDEENSLWIQIDGTKYKLHFGDTINATTLQGISVTDGMGKAGIVYINGERGVLEIGQIIDFHTAEGQDFKARLAVNHLGDLYLVKDTGESHKIGTMADLANYLPLTGGNVDALTIANNTVHHDGNSAKVSITDTDPDVGTDVSSTYTNGSIICVYE